MIKSFDEVFEDVTKLGVKMKTDEYHPIGKYTKGKRQFPDIVI